MFSGLVEDLGTVTRMQRLEAGARLGVATRLSSEAFGIGESVAIDGACMTVVEPATEGFVVEISAESLRRTTLGDLEVGDRVNLERSVRLQDRLGGHLVSGHVDGRGRIVAIRPEGESSIYTFGLARELARLTVEKGSVAIDGISLTCFHCRPDRFDAAIIPHTAEVTTLGVKAVGDPVNIENDLLAKYVEKLVEPLLTRSRQD